MGFAQTFHSHRALARWKGTSKCLETVLTVFCGCLLFGAGLKPGVNERTFEAKPHNLCRFLFVYLDRGRASLDEALGTP